MFVWGLSVGIEFGIVCGIVCGIECERIECALCVRIYRKYCRQVGFCFMTS